MQAGDGRGGLCSDSAWSQPSTQVSDSAIDLMALEASTQPDSAIDLMLEESDPCKARTDMASER
jgi:hypothetical protein